MQPTRPQLIAAALRRVVELQFAEETIKAMLRKEFGARLMALTQRQKTLMAVQYNAVVADIHQNLSALVNTIVGQGPAQAKCLLTDPELTAIMGAATLTGKPIDDNCGYLFDNMVYPTPAWTNNAVPLLEEAKRRVKALLDEADNLNAFLQFKADGQEQDCTKALARVQTLRQRAGQLAAEQRLGSVLGPLIQYVAGVLNGFEQDLADCTGAKLRQQFDALNFTFCGADDKTLASEEAWPLHQICLDHSYECNILTGQLQSSTFDTLRARLATPTQVTEFGKLLAQLGGPGFFAFIQCTAVVQTGVIDRWDQLAQDLLKIIPPDEREVATLKYYFGLMVAGKTWTDGLSAISAKKVRITLPAGITAAGWCLVNTCLMPQAFDRASFGTDERCMKHCVQELGNAPSQIKITNYFAQLCDASARAYQRWGQLNQTRQKILIVIGQVTWTFLIKLKGNRPVIYHIDSGYQNSPWVTRDK